MWDVLFYEGAKIMFHVALAIFKVQEFMAFSFAGISCADLLALGVNT